MNAVQGTAPIVVGYDGSAPSKAALHWAVEEAGRQRRPLRVVHAHAYPLAAVPPRQIVPVAEMTANARAVAAEGGAAALALAPGLAVSAEVYEEHPARALIDASGDAALLVVGARGTGGIAGMVLGSVSDHVAGHAHCPVVVTPTAEHAAGTATGPVVVGVDGSRLSDAALEFAFGYAAGAGLDLVAVSAWLPFHAGWTADAAVVDAWPQDVGAETQALSAALGPWREKYPAVRTEARVLVGSAVQALVQAGKDAALLVVGSHGHGTLVNLALGSVSRGVLHGATRPVAVVRDRR